MRVSAEGVARGVDDGFDGARAGEGGRDGAACADWIVEARAQRIVCAEEVDGRGDGEDGGDGEVWRKLGHGDGDWLHGCLRWASFLTVNTVSRQYHKSCRTAIERTIMTTFSSGSWKT